MLLKNSDWFSYVTDRIRTVLITRSSSLFMALMIANVIAYIYYVLMARMMIPAEYGVVVSVTAVSYLLDVIMRSIQGALTKSIASMGQITSRQARTVFVIAMRILLPTACLVALAVWLASGWAAKFLNLEDTRPVILLGVYASLHFLGPVPRGILLGLGLSDKASITIIIEPVIRLIAGVIFVAAALEANGALAGYILGAILTFLVGMGLLRTILRDRDDRGAAPVSLTGWDRLAFQVLVMNLFLMIIMSIDQIMVKHYFSPEVAGDFAATSILGRVLVMTGISLGIVVFTRSATVQQGEPKSQVLVKSLLAMGAISVTAVGVSVIAPATVIQLAAGSQYRLAHDYIGLVALEMSLFGFVCIQSQYQVSLGRMAGVWLLCLASALEVVLVTIFHASVDQILIILISVMSMLLIFISIITWRIIVPVSHRSSINPMDSTLVTPTDHPRG